METGPRIAHVASLVGDPTRASILTALLAGRALTASELAYTSGVTPQTASEHLAKLSDAGLLAQEKQGRHRYFRLASPLVGSMLEGLMVVAHDQTAHAPETWKGSEALRNARTCYDHIAGRLGVRICDRLIERSHVVLNEDGGVVTSSGRAFLREIGVELRNETKRRVLCRPCLDWSERRPHLAGSIGSALLTHAFSKDWIRRVRDGRALAVTALGRRSFADVLEIELEP
jgi:DNA-binding transcriptional ArsR family regulator